MAQTPAGRHASHFGSRKASAVALDSLAGGQFAMSPYATEYELKKAQAELQRSGRVSTENLRNGHYKQAQNSSPGTHSYGGRLGLGHPMHLAGRTGVRTP